MDRSAPRRPTASRSSAPAGRLASARRPRPSHSRKRSKQATMQAIRLAGSDSVPFAEGTHARIGACRSVHAMDHKRSERLLTNDTPESRRKAQLDGLLLKLPGVTARTISGLDAYFVSDKMFACISGKGVGLRLPVAVATELQFSRDNVFPFQPGRRGQHEGVDTDRQGRCGRLREGSCAVPGVRRVRRRRPGALARASVDPRGGVVGAAR